MNGTIKIKIDNALSKMKEAGEILGFSSFRNPHKKRTYIIRFKNNSRECWRVYKGLEDVYYDFLIDGKPSKFNNWIKERVLLSEYEEVDTGYFSIYNVNPLPATYKNYPILVNTIYYT